jgi:hypothetical protein
MKTCSLARRGVARYATASKSEKKLTGHLNASRWITIIKPGVYGIFFAPDVIS